MRRRRTVNLDRFKPVARDHRVGFRYTNPATGRETYSCDRWMRAPAHIAEAALWTGAEEFEVDGGAGARAWKRTVTVTQEQAERFLRDAADRDFTVKGMLKRALIRRDRRVAGA